MAEVRNAIPIDGVRADTKKNRICEAITNVANLGKIPREEVALNQEVIYDSIADQFCSVVMTESPQQVISTLRLVYGMDKSTVTDIGPVVPAAGGNTPEDSSILNRALLSGVAVPLDDGGYPTSKVKCTVILDSNNGFVVPLAGIIPGSININDGAYVDNGAGEIYSAEDVNDKLGTVDYFTGVIEFTGTPPSASPTLTYDYDIYNLPTEAPTIQFKKVFVETCAQMFHLSMDTAISLNEMKSLNIKDNIDLIIPQVLSQQIDQHIINQFFKQAQQQVLGSWDATAEWEGKNRAPVSLLYEDLGTFISVQTGEFARVWGINPNVLICSPLGFGYLSASKKFQPITNELDEKKDNAGTPKVVGWFNNMKVILSNQQVGYDDVNIVLTYKGTSEAMAACVYTPFIPVSLYSQTSAYNGFIQQNDAYSMGGITMINPELVAGIRITWKDV